MAQPIPSRPRGEKLGASSSSSPADARHRQHESAETRHFRSTLAVLATICLLPDSTLAPAGRWRLSLSPCLFKGKASPAPPGLTASRLSLRLAALQHGRPPSPVVASLARYRLGRGLAARNRGQWLTAKAFSVNPWHIPRFQAEKIRRKAHSVNLFPAFSH